MDLGPAERSTTGNPASARSAGLFSVIATDRSPELRYTTSPPRPRSSSRRKRYKQRRNLRATRSWISRRRPPTYSTLIILAASDSASLFTFGTHSSPKLTPPPHHRILHLHQHISILCRRRRPRSHTNGGWAGSAAAEARAPSAQAELAWTGGLGVRLRVRLLVEAAIWRAVPSAWSSRRGAARPVERERVALHFGVPHPTAAACSIGPPAGSDLRLAPCGGPAHGRFAELDELALRRQAPVEKGRAVATTASPGAAS